jgi:GH15 family glucan-1,4-alpha-glucosidase
VVACAGEARVTAVLGPRGSFGSEPVRRLARTDSGAWRARLGDVHLRWAGGENAKVVPDGHGGKALRLELDLAEGSHHDLVLVVALDEDDAGPPDPDLAWTATETAWRERVPELDLAVGARDARHAYAVISGLTTSGGGMVAAATTSLPEHERRQRDYDYRYVWIRDQCYAGLAVAKAGVYPLLDGAVRFVRDRLVDDGPRLSPAYTADGSHLPDEQGLDVPGYPGGSDVMVGNKANEQFQLDVFGEALLLFAAAAEHDRIDAETWRAAEAAAEAIEARWRESDAGIWELDPDEWTHGRLTCGAGLRAIASHRRSGEQAARWIALADAITADISARALHPSGRWQRSPDDERVDASLLLPPIRGAIPASDPRTLATLRAVVAELTVDGYAYRYRPDERPLGDAEGAFLLCGFFVSLAFAQQGDPVEAARWFERTRGACGPPGLLSEEFDVTQRQLRGNLPQAFVHALLLETAVEQDRIDDEDPRRLVRARRCPLAHQSRLPQPAPSSGATTKQPRRRSRNSAPST